VTEFSQAELEARGAEEFSVLLLDLLANGHRWSAKDRKAIRAYWAKAFPFSRAQELAALLSVGLGRKRKR
jgi:hypothetical protein